MSNNGVIALSNGHFLVLSSLWDNAPAVNAGAVTWGNGSIGEVGTLSTANSLIGSTSADVVGGSESVTLLSNGNYVVKSPYWDSGAAANAGAVTWGNAATGVKGTISAAKSLVGSAAEDSVGAVLALSNGHYVVSSYLWDNAAVADVGAVTWGSGTSGVKGVVSAANSLIGSTSGDQVGGPVALSNGNYVVGSSEWDNGSTANVGAVTWASGTGMTSGVVSAANSVIGTTPNARIGYNEIVALKNGNYLIVDSYASNGGLASAGAVTWCSGTASTSGERTLSNSLFGTQSSDRVGSEGVTLVNNGGYVVSSSFWRNGAFNAAGAVSFGSGTTGLSGGISASNSAFGLQSNAGLEPVVVDNVNGTVYARFLDDGGGRVRVGSQVAGFKSDASLSSLASSVGSLSPAFDKATLNYSLTAPNNTSSVTITPTVVDAGATLTVNGSPLTSGTASAPIDLESEDLCHCGHGQ